MRDNLGMRIVIYGAGEVGCMIATEFYEDHDITIIDAEENRIEAFNRLDIEIEWSGSGVDEKGYVKNNEQNFL